jgi:hypothetical protein
VWLRNVLFSSNLANLPIGRARECRVSRQQDSSGVTLRDVLLTESDASATIRSTNLQHNFAVVLPILQQGVGITSLLEWKDSSDHGMELAGGHPF